MPAPIRIGFFGTPALAADVLRACLDAADLEVAYVVTQADKPVGRHAEPRPSPVKALALERGIKVHAPEKIRKNAEFLDAVRADPVDYLVVVAYGKILPKEILDLPAKLPINVHGSILPAYRGAAPIQAAVADDLRETGVTIMRMTEGMDEGETLSIEPIAVDPDDTSGDLFAKFSAVCGRALVRTVRAYDAGEIAMIPQDDELATYTRKIDKEDGLLRFDQADYPVRRLAARVRALSPWPGASAAYGGKALRFDRVRPFERVHDVPYGTVVRLDGGEIGVACVGGFLICDAVTLEWRPSVGIDAFARGRADFIGYRFRSDDEYRMEPLSRTVTQ